MAADPAVWHPLTATTHTEVAVCAPVATVTVVDAVLPSSVVRTKHAKWLALLFDPSLKRRV